MILLSSDQPHGPPPVLIAHFVSLLLKIVFCHLKVKCVSLDKKKEEGRKAKNSHSGRASRNLASFLHAIEFPTAMCVSLAFHVIIIEFSTSCPNEKRGAHQRRRRAANFADFGNVVWERGGVNKDMLIESAIYQRRKDKWLKI